MAERLTSEQLGKMVMASLNAERSVMSGATPSERLERQEAAFIEARRLDQAVRASFKAMPVRRNG